MNSTLFKFIISGALFLFPLFSFSGNYDFLDETAGEYFTDSDWHIFLDAQNKVLNQYPDGSTLTWKNPESGSWGTFRPSHTIKTKGTICRDLTITSNANYRKGESTLTFCKEKGVWKGV